MIAGQHEDRSSKDVGPVTHVVRDIIYIFKMKLFGLAGTDPGFPVYPPLGILGSSLFTGGADADIFPHDPAANA